jgi:AcrR family transcriptional regulator
VKERELVKRSYQSPLRAAQAESTRRTVIAAAARLFSERGYVATSVDDIAAEAGVSRATVFTAVGGKPALLKTALDVAIVGDDQPVALPDRPRSRAVRAETDPRRYLALYAGIAAEIGDRAGAIYEAVRGAAGADPAARALLRAGLDPEAAADIVWVLNDPGLHRLLVEERRWTPEQFEAWLAETLQRQLLPD